LKKLVQISAFTFLIGLVIFGLTDCTKPVTVYPVEPHIELVDCHAVKDDDGYFSYVVTLNFTDGDGDLGLEQNEMDTPFNEGSLYNTNIHVDYFEKISGTFQKVTSTLGGTDTVFPKGRFPVITPDTKSKAVKGTMVATLFLGTWDPEPHRNNVTKLKIWINDRALHHSNVVETQEIVLK
jgi:hypothetical protein